MATLNPKTNRAEAIELLVEALEHINHLTDIVYAGVIALIGDETPEDWREQYDNALAFYLANPRQDARQLINLMTAQNGQE